MDTLETITRKQARVENLKRYFTGISCKYGHVAERVVSGGNCCECRRLHMKVWREGAETKPFKVKSTPDQEYLNARFSYEPLSGKLYWKSRPISDFRENKYHTGWNTRYANKEAGSLHYANGYREVRLDGSLHKAHRIIWKILTGQDTLLPLDHIDGVKDNNKEDNLRVVTAQENSRNTKTLGGVLKGVQKRGEGFRGCYCVDDLSYYSQIFSSALEAALWYDTQANRLYGKFASLNFDKEKINE